VQHVITYIDTEQLLASVVLGDGVLLHFMICHSNKCHGVLDGSQCTVWEVLKGFCQHADGDMVFAGDVVYVLWCLLC